ncbi:STAS domain-containing protein [Patescibacteria group bacterium]|nr:STAS domain-containing protein [Patescibacteria group bacterium]MBU1123170.1 STAS domain-containing protein [Patescibacteria group bacterium]MBU1911427.1 STAS domain-containing protein [Patescibacteria group bacterium]
MNLTPDQQVIANCEQHVSGITTHDHSKGQIVEIKIVGEMNEQDMDMGEIKDALPRLVQECRNLSAIVMDLKDTEYICSTGIGLLLMTKRLSESRKIKFHLCALSAYVRSLFEITGMDQLFEI